MPSNTRTRRRERRALTTRADDVVEQARKTYVAADGSTPESSIAELLAADPDEPTIKEKLIAELADTPVSDTEPTDGYYETELPEDVSMTWEGPLAVEGANTEDGRRLEPGSMSWRDLPLTLMAQVVTDEGHDGAQVAGRIDTIERRGDELYATGVFDDSDYGRDIARLVADETLRGVSIDMAILEMRWETIDGTVLDDDQAWLVEDPVVMVVTKGVILGATVCPFQAIADAQIAVVASKAGVLSWRAKVLVPFTVSGQTTQPPVDEPSTTPLGVAADRVALTLLAAALPDRLAAYREAIDEGLVSVNEVRDALGLTPIPGGDRVTRPVPEGVDAATHTALEALGQVVSTLASQRGGDTAAITEVLTAVKTPPRVVRIEPTQSPDAAALVAAALSDIGSRFADGNTALAEALSTLAERPAPTVNINERPRNVDAVRDDQGRIVGYREAS